MKNNRFHLNLDSEFQALARLEHPPVQYVEARRRLPTIASMITIMVVAFAIGLLL